MHHSAGVLIKGRIRLTCILNRPPNWMADTNTAPTAAMLTAATTIIFHNSLNLEGVTQDCEPPQKKQKGNCTSIGTRTCTDDLVELCCGKLEYPRAANNPDPTPTTYTSTPQGSIFGTLPDEILCHIFKFATWPFCAGNLKPHKCHRELLAIMTLALVCRKWWDVGYDPHFWKTLDLSRAHPICKLTLIEEEQIENEEAAWEEEEEERKEIEREEEEEEEQEEQPEDVKKEEEEKEEVSRFNKTKELLKQSRFASLTSFTLGPDSLRGISPGRSLLPVRCSCFLVTTYCCMFSMRIKALVAVQGWAEIFIPAIVPLFGEQRQFACQGTSCQQKPLHARPQYTHSRT